MVTEYLGRQLLIVAFGRRTRLLASLSFMYSICLEADRSLFVLAVSHFVLVLFQVALCSWNFVAMLWSLVAD